jgi:hypothetical protein
MPPLLFVLIAIIGVTGMLLWVGALVDAVQYDDAVFDHVGRDKRPTVMLILFHLGLRRRLVLAAREATAASRDVAALSPRRSRWSA